ncbi:MAG: phage tail assembly chaperone [Pseudomonadota bacterium]
MTTSFSEAAPQWAAIASQLLGWRPAEFWQATPAELATALRAPDAAHEGSAPSRTLIAELMERDENGR